MGIQQFTLKFDRTPVYRPGQMVSGVVTIALDKPETHNGVVVQMLGLCCVQWKDNRRRCIGEATYFQDEIILTNGGSELAAGTHKLPFSYALPLGIPRSFEGRYGHVRYTARCMVVRPWTVDYYGAERQFLVLSILDLNLIPPHQCRPGIAAEDSKNLCCLCCRSGPITVKASLPQSGYALGELLMLDVEVDNQSDAAVEVVAALIQLVEYHIEAVQCFKVVDRKKLEKNEVSRIAGKILPPKESMVWTDEKIRIDEMLPPTDLGGDCSCIRVRYEIRVIVDPLRPAVKMILRLPVVIGTVPLGQVIPDSLHEPPVNAPEVQRWPWSHLFP